MIVIVSKEQIKDIFIDRHGKENYDRLKKAKVAIAGLGGLGSNIAISLVRAGIGHIHIVDFDKVDLSNIHRQQYFLDDIGKFKADALCESLKKINPYIDIKKDIVKVTEDNIKELFEDDEYICEAFDKAECKAMLVNNILENFPDKYVIAGSGMSGDYSANMIKTKKIMKHLYISGDGKSEVSKEESLFAPRVAICANHQALTVIRLILEKYEV